jgi:hypothetical protein
MSRSTDKVSVPAAIAVGAVAVIALIASGVLRPSPVTGAAPSNPPSAAPSVPGPTAVPAPTEVPASPSPTASPSDGADGRTVKLDIAPDKDVFVTVDDEDGVITDVRTGHASDGMSVAWHEMKVENLGPSTLQLTWIGFADTERLVVTKGERGGTFDLTLVEINPPNVIDATGYDRVLILEFAVPVNAKDITYSIDNGPKVDAGNEWDVELDIATDDDVVVTVEDEQAQVVDARTGHAGDGMSVRWFNMKIENVDELMLRVTWVGFAADEQPVLKIGERDGHPELTLIQAGPPPNSDALGFDRVLILEFNSPVNAADVLYSIQGGLDTDD